jgi:ribose-phosphate pyrophosphokinase
MLKTINLVDEQASEVKYKILRFPDGQQNIVLDLKEIEEELDGSYDSLVSFNIVTRLNSWKDLELIFATTACLRDCGFCKNIHLVMPYLLGSRSDRKFEEGGNNYLKDVICPLINYLEFDDVTIFDPHSDVTEALINRVNIESNVEFIKWVLNELDGNVNVICPDAGAQKKIWKVCEECNIPEFISASKHRDIRTGKITHTYVPIEIKHLGNDYLIIDDICDGGRTFIEIAKEILKIEPTARIYLAVSHGIFSAGFDELKKYFTGIFCTNSYQDIEDNYFDGWKTKSHNGFIKQFKVI